MNKIKKYRIKVTTDGLGIKKYYPQHRFLLFFWIYFKSWCGMEYYDIIWYESLKEAENHIKNYVDFLRINRKKKIVKREYFVVSYKVE